MYLDELELSVRTYNCLKRAGIDTVEQLRKMSDEQLMRVKNLNQKCMNEAKRAAYCTDCKRSIYGEYKNCDGNIENKGKYIGVDFDCGCKVRGEL